MTWRPKKSVPLAKLIGAVNICELLDVEDLTYIGRTVAEGYANDDASRSDWTRRQADANKLALQAVEQRTEPWPNAANVKFPLVTVAAMQFQARFYPGLISGTDLVKCRVIGKDEDGEKTARAERIATHMSWQCLEQDQDWEEDHDKLGLVMAIAGACFIKTGYEPGPGKIVSQLVLPNNLVISYKTRSLYSSERYTHTFDLTSNKIRQRELDGRFRVLSQDPGSASSYEQEKDNPPRADGSVGENAITEARDKRQGLTKSAADDVTLWFTGEQYCWWDLDGDGYKEPYIVTFDIGSGMVRRIVARYLASGVKFLDGEKLTDFAKRDGEGDIEYDIPREAKVYKITAVRVFTKFGFVPSPDGGFYDLGLGSLEGPINATVNTLINQMLDAGTMITLGGGFLGRAFRGRGGPITFAPGQWHPLDNAGDDIRKSVLPRPDPVPPDFLFKLLGLLLQYAERIVSANDIQLGENPGQNTPAQTTQTLNENGARVYNAIFKRGWRSLRDEYRIRYELNALYLSADVDFEDLTTGRSALIRPDDYSGSSLDVRPAADPHVVSDAQAERQGVTLIQLAASQPGFNRYRTTLRYLKAIKVPNIEEVYPPPMTQGPDGKPQPAKDHPPTPNPKMIEAQIKQQEFQLEVKRFQSEQMQAKIDTQMAIQESIAHVHELEAKAIKFAAEAKGAEVEPLIKMIYAQIESEGKRRDSLLKFAEMIDKKMERADGATGNQQQPGVGGAQAQPGVTAVPKANGGIAQAGMGGMGL